jgi:two-component system, NarL family, response regulator DesR
VIRVLVADDQPLVRAGVSALLAAEPDIDVVAVAADGGEALALARSTRPDVAVLDIRMPVRNGIEVARELCAADADPAVPVLVLTTFDLDDLVFGALEAGASGFLLKDAPASQLANAIRRALTGERVVDPGLAAAALAARENPLTPREREVLATARTEGTVAELAAALHLSPGTARNHLSSIMQKLGAHSRIEAIRIAEEKGWL